MRDKNWKRIYGARSEIVITVSFLVACVALFLTHLLNIPHLLGDRETYWNWTGMVIEISVVLFVGFLASALIRSTEAKSKRASEALQKSEERFRKISELTSDYITKINIDPQGKMMVEMITEGFTRISGFTVDEVKTPDQWSKVFHPDDLGKLSSSLKEIISGKQIEIEIRGLTKKGETRRLHVYGHPVWDKGKKHIGSIILAARDITERKKTEEAVKESERKYRELVETSIDMIFTLDLKGDFLFTNKAWKRRLGFSDEEIHNINGFALIHPQDIEITKGKFAEVLQGKTVENLEFRSKTKDGSFINVLVNASPLFDSKGNVVAVLGVAKDITDIKKAQEELLRLSTAVKTSTDSIVICDLEGKIVDVNEATLRMYGAEDKGKLIGENTIELIAPEDRENALKGIQETLEKGYQTSREYRVITKNGRRVLIELSAALMKDANGKPTGFVGISRDITDRKKAEKALKESDERYQALFNRSLECIYLHDLEGNFIDANPSALNLLGYSKGEITSLNFTSLLDKEQLPRAMHKLEEIKLAGFQKDLTEYRLKRKEGGCVYVETKASVIYRDGKPYAIQGIARDVTERKKAEEALRESEEKFRVLFDASAEGILVADIKTKEFKYTNPTASRMLGYTEDEFAKMSVADIHPKESLPYVISEFEAQARGEKTLAPNIPCLRKDGTTIYVNISTAKVLIKGRELNVGFFTDVTELRKAEQALKESEEKFRTFSEQSPNMIFINQKGLVAYANKKCEEEMGYRKEEFYSPGFDFLSLIAPESREAVKENFGKYIKGQEVPPREYTFITREGKRIDVILTTKLIGYGGDVALLGIATDISERKKAEERIKAEKEFSEKLISTANAIIIGLDRKHKIMLFSQGAERITGYRAKEVLGKDWFEIFFKKEMHPKMTKVWEDAWGKDSHSHINPIYSKSGKKIITQWSNTSIKNEQEEPIMLLCIAIDITELKRAEEALRTSEAQLSNAAKIAKLGYWEYDVADNLFTFNDHFYAIFRTSADKVGGYKMTPARYAETFLHPDDISVVATETKKALETRDPNYSRQLEHRIIYADGEIGYISVRFSIVKDNQGCTVKTYGVNQDITERKRAEEARRESEKKYRTLLENLPQKIFYKDKNSVYISCNENYARDLKIKSDEITGKTDYDFYPEELAEKYIADDKRIIHSGEAEDIDEEYVKDGEKVYVHTVKTPVKDDKGNVVGILGVFWDITETKKLQQQLMQSEKLAAVGTLAYGIAHEFNNVLAGLMGNAEFGLITDNPKDIKESFETIVETCQRAKSITTNLLVFARPKEAKKETTDVIQPLKTVLSLTKRELEKANIKVVEEYNPTPKILCDPGQFSEVFLNMITNARDAMIPKGGTLSIKVDSQDDNIRIVFKDTGCGIPEKIKGRIFDPFVTSKGALGKSEIPGTGLGLFVTYGIIDNYGGKIEVDSKEDSGTTFTILIPISKNLPTDGTVEKAKIQIPKKIEGKLNILLVDDEKPICVTLKRFLESKGHQVATTLKAKQGLELFQNEKFDVVLSDITMPDMDGIELIKELKKKDKGTKIIVMTGHVQKRKESEAKEAGADEVLVKPFKNDILYQAISKVIM